MKSDEQLENEKIPLELYKDEINDPVKQKVDELWESLMTSLTSPEEMDRAFDELMDRIEEYEVSRGSR